jgi:hypothetical protein
MAYTKKKHRTNEKLINVGTDDENRMEAHLAKSDA